MFDSKSPNTMEGPDVAQISSSGQFSCAPCSQQGWLPLFLEHSVPLFTCDYCHLSSEKIPQWSGKSDHYTGSRSDHHHQESLTTCKPPCRSVLTVAHPQKLVSTGILPVCGNTTFRPDIRKTLYEESRRSGGEKGSLRFVKKRNLNFCEEAFYGSRLFSNLTVSKSRAFSIWI